MAFLWDEYQQALFIMYKKDLSFGDFGCIQERHPMSPSSSGLGHRPLMAKTGVRLPLGIPYIGYAADHGDQLLHKYIYDGIFHVFFHVGYLIIRVRPLSVLDN